VNYTTALLGQSRSFLYVDGPHQQISVIDEIRDVKTTNVSLLHLKNAVNFTRYVQPLFLEKKCVHWFINYHIDIIFFLLSLVEFLQNISIGDRWFMRSSRYGQWTRDAIDLSSTGPPKLRQMLSLFRRNFKQQVFSE